MLIWPCFFEGYLEGYDKLSKAQTLLTSTHTVVQWTASYASILAWMYLPGDEAANLNLEVFAAEVQ